MRMLAFAIAAIVLDLSAMAIQAQAQQPAVPVPDRATPGDRRQDPQLIDPPARPGETLSERLDRTDGVIRPPTDITRDNNTIRPPDPGTTRVIPPPGSPGGDPTIRPK